MPHVVAVLLRRCLEELRRLSATDTLTGLPNRRAFDRRLREEWLGARRYESPLSLLLVDVDGLKQINDEHGRDAALHQAKDDGRNCVRVA
jgi:PleD family two-component response regulator